MKYIWLLCITNGSSKRKILFLQRIKCVSSWTHVIEFTVFRKVERETLTDFALKEKIITDYAFRNLQLRWNKKYAVERKEVE